MSEVERVDITPPYVPVSRQVDVSDRMPRYEQRACRDQLKLERREGRKAYREGLKPCPVMREAALESRKAPIDVVRWCREPANEEFPFMSRAVLFFILQLERCFVGGLPSGAGLCRALRCTPREGRRLESIWFPRLGFWLESETGRWRTGRNPDGDGAGSAAEKPAVVDRIERHDRSYRAPVDSRPWRPGFDIFPRQPMGIPEVPSVLGNGVEVSPERGLVGLEYVKE